MRHPTFVVPTNGYISGKNDAIFKTVCPLTVDIMTMVVSSAHHQVRCEFLKDRPDGIVRLYQAFCAGSARAGRTKIN
jgi:hypothetical protein